MKDADRYVPREFMVDRDGFVASVHIKSFNSKPRVPMNALILFVIHPSYPSTWMFLPIVNMIGPNIISCWDPSWTNLMAPSPNLWRYPWVLGWSVIAIMPRSVVKMWNIGLNPALIQWPDNSLLASSIRV